MADKRLIQAAVATAELLNPGDARSPAKESLKIIALASCVLLASCQERAPALEASSVPVRDTIAVAGEKVNAIATNQNDISEAQLKSIVKEVMDDQYGSQYDARYDCWPYTSGDSAAYCMKPSAAKLINEKNGKAIYFYAANRSDINDDLGYVYSHSDSGLMGAFKLSVDSSGDWKYSAASKAMDFGSAGYCGCDKAEFVKLGNNDLYGWMFTSGGVWQGTVVTDYAIIAPKDSVFKNLSSIPEVREEEQDIKYRIKIIDSSADSIFPLLVTKAKTGVAPEEKTISFDQEKWLYSLPKEF